MNIFSNAPLLYLVAFYNANSGARPVRKFKSRAIAEQRCAALLPKLEAANRAHIQTLIDEARRLNP